jgi:hypothetical protein
MGFENEVEQSNGRPCRRLAGRRRGAAARPLWGTHDEIILAPLRTLNSADAQGGVSQTPPAKFYKISELWMEGILFGGALGT